MSLTLKDVERLGGTKEEFDALGGVESGSEMEFGTEEERGGENSLPRGEIEAFIRHLGLMNGTTLQVSNTEAAAESKKNKKTKQREKEGTKSTIIERRQQQQKKKGKKSAVKSTAFKATNDEKTEEGESEKEEVERQLLGLSAASPHTRLLVSPDAERLWFDQSVSTEAAYPVSESTLTHLRTVAQQLMETETQLYEKVREKKKGLSDVRWLRNVLSSGTLSDKVAAHTLLVQESPVHSLSSLDWLLGLVAKQGGNVMKGLHAKRKGILAINTLKELWVSELLPEHRKLKSLQQRPLNLLLPSPNSRRPSSQSSRESQSSKGARSWQCRLLLWFCEDHIKSRYLQFVTALQAAMHDPAEEVREKMVGHVFDLLYQRPEQEQLLLTQLVNKLGDPHRKVASKTVMFLLKLLNHHVNMKVIVAREIESLLHRPNISSKAQYYGVCCLNQIVLGPQDGLLVAKLIDVYFTFFKVYIKQSGLDSKMLGALLTGVNRAFPFMSEELPSFEDHLHSLFKVVHVGPISTGIQSLMLLHQVMESRQSVSDRYYNALYSKLLDPALKHCNRQAMFLNVLFKSLKSDPSMSRLKAFVKRMLQVCLCHSPSFVCGCLILLSELLKEKAALWPYVLQGNDEENYRDVPVGHTEEEEEGGRREGDEGDSEESGGVRSDLGEEGGEQKGRGCRDLRDDSFKMWHRNPEYSGAENSCLWELSQLSRHYHPSVQLFSRKIASGETLAYTSDPLEDFTTIKFLDRFVYKNPKLKPSDHGGSAMQRVSKCGLTSKKELMANSAAFAALDKVKVDVKELFLHRYFNQRGGKVTGNSKGRGGELMESEGEEGEEGAYADMDFAGELQKEMGDSKIWTEKRKRKRKEQDESSEDSADANRFDLDEEAWEDSGEEGEEEGDTVSEAQLEKLLLENMSDDELGPEGEGDKDDVREGETKKRKKAGSKLSLKGKFDSSKMFAAADEFSHLLEDGPSTDHTKQLAWEEKRSGHRGRGGKREGRGRERGRRGRGSGGSRIGGGRGGKERERGGKGQRGGIRGSRGGGGVKRRRVERGSGGGCGGSHDGGRGVRRGRRTRRGTNSRT